MYDILWVASKRSKGGKMKEQRPEVQEACISDVLAISIREPKRAWEPICTHVIGADESEVYCWFCEFKDIRWHIDETKSVVDADIRMECKRNDKNEPYVSKSSIILSGPRAKLEILLEKFGYATLLERKKPSKD